MRIERMETPEQAARWNAYVARHPSPANKAHAGWRAILSNCFAVTPRFLMAVEDDGAVRGTLPLYYTDSFLTGPQVTALDGGATADADAVGPLYDAARAFVEETGAKNLLARGGPLPADVAPAGGYDTVWTPLDTTVDAESAFKRLSSNTRRKVRKAEKNGYTFTAGGSLDDFYAVYAENVRDLGTPVTAPCLFHAMTKHLGDAARLYTVRRDGRLVGGMLATVAGSVMTSQYVAVLNAEKSRYASYLLYWRAIEAACADPSLTTLDLGRSVPESGNHVFKGQWGGVDVTVRYQYLHATGPVPADVRKEGGLVRKLWSRLPLLAANRLGPAIRHKFPFA